MQLFESAFPIQPLFETRSEWPGMAKEDEWKHLCAALETYTPPPISAAPIAPDEKWNAVSTYQKSVRRGQFLVAMKIVSGMVPTEDCGYLWKRVCTTAAEDIGPANDALMNFVIQCSKTYTPKRAPDYQFHILAFLTQAMCESAKSRMYCSLSIIENNMKTKPSNLTKEEEGFLKQIRKINKQEHWAVQNNWRGEGMLKFQLFDGMQLVANGWEPPAPTMICGFPDYAFDMHTRIGKTVCSKLVGRSEVKEFFGKHPTNDKTQAVGYALFFAEGGRILHALRDSRIALLEQKFVSSKFGYSDEKVWMQLIDIISKLVDSRVVNMLRQSTLIR